MSAVAERTILRRTAAAQSNGFLAAQIKRIAVRVFDGDRTGYKQRTIVANIEFNIRHIQFPFRIGRQAAGPQSFIQIRKPNKPSAANVNVELSSQQFTAAKTAGNGVLSADGNQTSSRVRTNSAFFSPGNVKSNPQD